MSNYRIPFNKPTSLGNELQYIEEAIKSNHLSGDGNFTHKCHKLLELELNVPKILLTTSCTHALEMSALLLDIQEGDEVIIPDFTFVSTVNAFVLRGAHPIFADIRLDTLNIDESRLESLITPRTRAIVVVHYAGVGCEMNAIMEIAARHGIKVVEDNAHGLFGRYHGRSLGTFGSFATQSFHETKNFTCGEGGALLINDGTAIERAEIIREKGTNRTKFFRGQVDKYSWVDVGSSFLPSDMLAAFLYAQLEQHELIQGNRHKIWNRYDAALRSWSITCGVSVPTVPSYCEQASHMYYLLLPSLEQRQSLIAWLKRHGILAVFHYLPLHLSDMGRRFGGRIGDCPVTENVSDRLLRLPFYTNITTDEQDEVIAVLKEFDEL